MNSGITIVPRSTTPATHRVAEETAMPSSKEAKQRAAKTAVKEERARDAARAMQEYEAQKVAARAKTARLRALRLAKEAETGSSPAKKTKTQAKGKR
jgi:hypothetical protein